MHSSLYIPTKTCFSTLVAALIPLAFLSDVAIAQQVTFNPPNGGAPKTTTGAATRDASCLVDAASQTKKALPVLPKSNYGLTFSSRPELLILKTKSTAKQVFFSLESEDGENVHQGFLPLPVVNGSIAINFPSQAPDLPVNSKYKWTVTFICGKALRADSPSISGWIKRVPRSQPIMAKLSVATPLERVAIYGENGIWYDMINELNQLKNLAPNNPNISKTWEKLLKDHVF